MSAARYEPVLTDEPAAAETANFDFDFYCKICKTHNCKHWEISHVRIDRGPDTTLWRFFGPYPITTCEIRCVVCNKFAHNGAVRDSQVILCSQRAHVMTIFKKQKDPPRAPPVVVADAADAKTAAAKPDAKAAAAPPAAAPPAAAPPAAAPPEAKTIEKKAVIFQDETVMCAKCSSKFTIGGSCEHWAVSKSPKAKHCELWCMACDPKHEKTPLQISEIKRLFGQRCPTCASQAWSGMQNMTWGGNALIANAKRADCKKCRGDGWIVAPQFGVCPMCAGTGGLACACAGEACACVAGYKKKCQVCDGQRAVEKACNAAVRCPFCRVE